MVRAGRVAGRDGGGQARVGEHVVVHEVGPLPGWTVTQTTTRGRRWMGGTMEVRVGGVLRVGGV